MTNKLTDTERIDRLQELVDEYNALLLYNRGETKGFTGLMLHSLGRDLRKAIDATVASDAEVRAK